MSSSFSNSSAEMESSDVRAKLISSPFRSSGRQDLRCVRAVCFRKVDSASKYVAAVIGQRLKVTTCSYKDKSQLKVTYASSQTLVCSLIGDRFNLCVSHRDAVL